MSPKAPEEILGLEYDWLASDADGNVAFLSTAGGGYAPPAFLQDTDVHDHAIDAILGMPVSTSADFFPQVTPGLENPWRKMAERGVYAFDADIHGGPYRMVAAPKQSAHISSFPEEALKALKGAVFHNLNFKATGQISRQDLEGI